MRLLSLTVVILAGLAPAALSAQDQAAAPVAVEFDAAGNILDPNRMPTCAEVRERMAAREVERQRALAAGEEPPRPYFAACVREDAPSTTANRFTSPGQIASAPSGDLPIAARSDFTLADTRRAPAETRPAEQSNAARFSTSSDSSYSRSGQIGQDEDVRFEASASETCTDNGYERTCSRSNSFSIGNDEEARNSAREALDRLLDDDD